MGKSWAGSYDLIRRAKPNRLYMVVAPTYPMLSDSSFRSFLETARRLNVIDEADVRKSPPSARLRTGAEIIFRSADDPDRLRGPNLSGAWMDEASQMSQDAYDILIATLREGGEFGWLSATFTPKGRQHWTYEVFGSGRPDCELFHAASRENPFLPAEFFTTVEQQYGAGSVMAQQELEGLFVEGGGLLFQRQWFADKYVDAVPDGVKWCRYWDLAATAPKAGKDPDYTVGTLMGREESTGRFYVADVRRIRASPLEVEHLVKSTANSDGTSIPVRMEQEPGSSGVNTIDHYRRMVLAGFMFDGVRSTGTKEERARPLSGMCQAGHVYIRRATWNRDWLDELDSFPNGKHDDQVDSAAGAFSAVNRRATVNLGIY